MGERLQRINQKNHQEKVNKTGNLGTHQTEDPWSQYEERVSA
jgi:hypothetical protein